MVMVKRQNKLDDTISGGCKAQSLKLIPNAIKHI